MSLQKRLLVYLLLCAPLVWSVALYFSIDRARAEVNELFDTELIRLARQVQATLVPLPAPATAASAPALAASGHTGEADVRDLAIAVWDQSGRLLMADREGVQLPRRTDAAGFQEQPLDGQIWRLYYLQSAAGEWLVAAGQNVHERDELVYNLTASQLLPWLLVLPVLMLTMAWAVRQAIAPVHQLTDQLQRRSADDLRPVPQDGAPAELKPLVGAMNGLFLRIDQALERERRFTSDAAHELRTPLAVLRAQWDVMRGASQPAERAQAEARLGAGLDRIDRLVSQLLALSRLEATAEPPQRSTVQWPAIVEQAMSDCLATAEARDIELACDWPPEGQAALPLQGDPQLLTVLLRNLLDNAVHYAPLHSSVALRFEPDRLVLDNGGPPLPAEQLARMGERFYRPAGQAHAGSGLGVSIVQRIAALHGLTLRYRARAEGRGVVAELAPAGVQEVGELSAPAA